MKYLDQFEKVKEDFLEELMVELGLVAKRVFCQADKGREERFVEIRKWMCI